MSLEVPHEFVNDTPADATEVNANFAAVVNAFNSHLQETNPHNITIQKIGAAAASHTHTFDAIQEKPSEYPPTAHEHQWSDIKSVPSASIAAKGIVQLTSERNNSSEELALTAKAMDDHNSSADHDGRYYTKAQIVEFFETYAWFEPSDTVLVQFPGPYYPSTRDYHSGDYAASMIFQMSYNGRFRIKGEAKSNGVNEAMLFFVVPAAHITPREEPAEYSYPVGYQVTEAFVTDSNTYVSFSFDMNISVPAGTPISAFFLGYRPGAQFRNLKICADVGEAPQSTVIWSL